MSEYHYLTLIDLISETYAIRKIQSEEDPYFMLSLEDYTEPNDAIDLKNFIVLSM